MILALFLFCLVSVEAKVLRAPHASNPRHSHYDSYAPHIRVPRHNQYEIDCEEDLMQVESKADEVEVPFGQSQFEQDHDRWLKSHGRVPRQVVFDYVGQPRAQQSPLCVSHIVHTQIFHPPYAPIKEYKPRPYRPPTPGTSLHKPVYPKSHRVVYQPQNIIYGRHHADYESTYPRSMPPFSYKAEEMRYMHQNWANPNFHDMYQPQKGMQAWQERVLPSLSKINQPDKGYVAGDKTDQNIPGRQSFNLKNVIIRIPIESNKNEETSTETSVTIAA